MTKEHRIQTTSVSLHMIAMAIMLIDHFKKVFPDVAVLPSIGRVAFPIFAFLIVEGYFHTRDLGKYVRRLLLFAVLAEIPADLMSRGQFLYDGHQNVLWTFLIGLGLIHINEKMKENPEPAWRVFAAVSTVVVGYIVGMLTMVDYSQAGVLTVLAFYFFRGRKWWCYAGQLVSLAYLHFVVLGGNVLTFSLFGQTISFPRQGLAVLALIPIWLYRGEQGRKTRWFQYFCYAFYPVHMLIVAVLAGNASPGLLPVLFVPAACGLLWRVMGEQRKAALKDWSDKNLTKLLIDASVILLAAAPVVSLLYPTPSTAYVMYFENQVEYKSFIEAEEWNWISTTDRTQVEEWWGLYKESAPAEKQTQTTAFSRPFPCYWVVLANGERQIVHLLITGREVAVGKPTQAQVWKYVGYTPYNPYFDQAADLFAAMG